MAYGTRMELGKKVVLLHAGITIHVKKNGTKLGRLEVSKGGIRWLDAGKSKKGPNLTWDQLVDRLS